MALINCPNCGKSVSDSTEKCIHCGYDFKNQATLKLTEQTKLFTTITELSKEKQKKLKIEFNNSDTKIEQMSSSCIHKNLHSFWVHAEIYLNSILINEELSIKLLNWGWIATASVIVIISYTYGAIFKAVRPLSSAFYPFIRNLLCPLQTPKLLNLIILCAAAISFAAALLSSCP